MALAMPTPIACYGQALPWPSSTPFPGSPCPPPQGDSRSMHTTIPFLSPGALFFYLRDELANFVGRVVSLDLEFCLTARLAEELAPELARQVSARQHQVRAAGNSGAQSVAVRPPVRPASAEEVPGGVQVRGTLPAMHVACGMWHVP